MDLPRQRRDLLGQLLVLPGEVGVRLEQPLQLARRALDGSLVLGGVAGDLLTMRLDHLGGRLVAIRLPGLREQDQRCGVGGLGREGEVEQDERVRIPVADQRDRVERDPDDHRAASAR